MLKIGVTGGIGCGKSLVCSIFGMLGVPVFNADHEAKMIINNNKKVKIQLVNLFGKDIYDENNNIIGKKLGSIVFNDKEKIMRLNSITHPEVINSYYHWLEKHENDNYTIIEAAIIFEGGYENLLDYIIMVYAPEELRILRAMKRDNCDEDTVLEKMKNQLNDENKISRSQFVIYNDDKQLVIPQILKINDKLLLYQNNI